MADISVTTMILLSNIGKSYMCTEYTQNMEPQPLRTNFAYRAAVFWYLSVEDSGPRSIASANIV